MTFSDDVAYMQMMQRFPSAVLEATRDMSATASTSASGISTPALDIDSLKTQLTTLQFRPAHIKSCLSAISAAYARLHSSSSSASDPLVLSLSILSPLEAAIEWLLLHLPEDDLPMRYRPSASSADFITGASAKEGGQNALVKGWLVDKLVKQAGFPRKAVQSVMETEGRESVALDKLGRKLCGWDEPDEYGEGWQGDETAAGERRVGREEEVLAVEAVLGDRFEQISPTEFAVTIGEEGSKDTIRLHVLFDQYSPYPSPSYPSCPPTFYLASDSLPAYMRLHLHRQLLSEFRDPERSDLTSVLESGSGGAVLSMIEFLETNLPLVIETPPDVGEVTKYLIPKAEESLPAAQAREARRNIKKRGPAKRRIPTAEDEEKIRKKQKDMQSHRGWESMLAVRTKLPAWAEKDRINAELAKNRVLVVIGETGCGKRYARVST
jgi:ATP-dependent RNA helicase DHX57